MEKTYIFMNRRNEDILRIKQNGNYDLDPGAAARDREPHHPVSSEEQCSAIQPTATNPCERSKSEQSWQSVIKIRHLIKCIKETKELLNYRIGRSFVLTCGRVHSFNNLLQIISQASHLRINILR